MITVARRVAADPASVWRVMSALDEWARMLPTVDAVSRVGDPGPVAVGSRFRVRQPGLAPAVYEVTDWRPEAGFTWEARTAGVRTVASHALVPDGAGTEIRLSIRWTGPGAWLARALFTRKTRAFLAAEADAFERLAQRPA
ncbi:SRPBCC family protein [Streptomonospora nanhaiensis]|uniref:Carbon monoxide dehydrogenase subunit G n=1 Tax=Streptomonospora nanhaiensis TaxID=1323731 RepID=A0A853BVR1_9ACTN|nr:SRPBCC family protein [Streptomonospora nanhaiensis]MBV2364479.1 SRPBCC family protein [Streptomonospora nanhaiensis]MBX9390601.1 SRPBCC family protein [Streptomonospora nanhaiensis]NYI99173.1 carbon monoxide dehydrogenase subunit G [Streptomonospora nanhaiensis]